MESLHEMVETIGIEQGLLVWIIFLAGKEIRRLYQQQIEAKEALYQQQQDHNHLLRKTLETLKGRFTEKK